MLRGVGKSSYVDSHRTANTSTMRAPRRMVGTPSQVTVLLQRDAHTHTRYDKEDDEEEEDCPLKPKLNYALLPWLANDAITKVVIFPILLKTREHLQNYRADLKKSKKLLTTSFDVPQFSDSEWNNVLSGRAVDLDQVPSSAYTILHNQRRVGKLAGGDSDIEITMGGSSAPAKIVTNQGEWSITWKYAAKAIVFAFPERKPELEEYEEYITHSFMAMPVGLDQYYKPTGQSQRSEEGVKGFGKGKVGLENTSNILTSSNLGFRCYDTCSIYTTLHCAVMLWYLGYASTALLCYAML